MSLRRIRNPILTSFSKRMDEATGAGSLFIYLTGKVKEKHTLPEN